MERCDECKHWEPVSTARGTCRKLIMYQGGLVQASGDGDASTWNTFGCPLFEPKPKGPFKVEKTERGYSVIIGNRLIENWFHQTSAKAVRDILNDEWERRE